MSVERFVNTEKLYHYTKYQSALMIILTNSMRFGKLVDMNDYIESNKIIGCKDGGNGLIENSNTLNSIQHYLSSIGQISLTNGHKKYGFDIEPMWSHYAEKGKGICFVFDRRKLLEKAKEMRCWCRLVAYKKHISQCYVTEINSVEEVVPYFSTHRKSVFFEKSKDWKYEQEYRILCTNPRYLALQLDDCIVGVILHCSSLSLEEIEERKKIFSKLEIPVYEYNDKIFGGGEKTLKYDNTTIYSLK